MSHTITERKKVPDAPVYVLCNDTFMSGWGEARGKINTIILPCASMEEARTVEANARRRSDQKRVRIVINKPKFRAGVLYSLLTRDDAVAWFQPGAFCQCHED